MDTEHYRHKLLAKEKELLADMAQLKAEAIASIDLDVQDEMDMVVRSETKDALLNHNSMEYDLLTQVRGALRRIDEGTFGSCQVCGRPIDEKRLEAIPWAAYDLQHQAQQDKAAERARGGPGL